MGRWGEEEKKSKGIFGCLFAFGVMALFIYTFTLNYPQLQARAAMEKKMGSLITQNWRETDAELKVRIRDLAIEEGGTLTLEDIDLSRSQFESSWIFKVRIGYNIKVNILINQFEVDYPIFLEQMIVY